MLSVTGRLQYDANRTAVSSTSNFGLQGVTIILQDLSTEESGVGLTVATLTSGNGDFNFTNVPAGSYQLVEAYGVPTTYTAGADWSTAVIRPIIDGGTTPPISYASPHAPVSATHLDCTIRNTRLLTNISTDQTGQDFLNGPVAYIPMTLDSGLVVIPTNLVKDADNGTFGSFNPGTLANTGAGSYPANQGPYPEIQPQFSYTYPLDSSTVTPIDGHYTVQNIMNNAHSNSNPTPIASWWRVADHTTGNEMGRMMVVNGDGLGKIIGQTTIAVSQNTNYLTSYWILNLCKNDNGSYADPAFGVVVLGENGDTIFDEDLGVEIPINPNCPEWKQIGAVFNTGNNTEITIQFFSKGPAATGNDYALDDVALYRLVDVPELIVTKDVSCSFAAPGGTLYYEITIENNTSDFNATQITIHDDMPNLDHDSLMYSVDAGQSWEKWTGSLVVDDIFPGEFGILLLRGSVALDSSGTITNSASVDVTFCPVINEEE